MHLIVIQNFKLMCLFLSIKPNFKLSLQFVSRGNSCFCNYREIFLFHQDMILVPKVYTTIPVCMLHVVNNDTMEQVPKLFQKVVPYLYTKNKVGIKFILPVR